MSNKPIIRNTENTMGILNISTFNGISVKISREYLEKALDTMRVLGDRSGMDTKILTVGISGEESNGKAFLIFLDTNKTLALGIAGIRDEED